MYFFKVFLVRKINTYMKPKIRLKKKKKTNNPQTTQKSLKAQDKFVHVCTKRKRKTDVN